MQHDSPLRNRHQAWLAAETDRIEAQVNSADRPGAATADRQGELALEYLPYGPGDESGAPSCEIVSSFGAVESEYASIRRGVGLLDAPHRAIIELRGTERLSFLDSMITQAVGNLAPGSVRRSFWLDRKGRIVSDLVVANLDDRCLLELDVHAAATTLETLDNYLFAEDATIEWTPEATTQLRLHGSASLAALTAVLESGAAPGSDAITEGRIAGCSVTLLRCDETGEPGVSVITARGDAEAVWDALLAWSGTSGNRMRPIGWSAFNTARIEAGVPLFNVDFGSDAIPQETGVIEDRVSFNKGCYLGQEIVARIHSLGNPKQRLVALDLKTEGLPVAGTQIFARVETQDGAAGFGPQVGWVTSSTLSPMLGAQPIALAMVRFEQAQAETRLLLTADGESIDATVRDQLSFLPGADS
jgi:folate-binding protein YgfZ